MCNASSSEKKIGLRKEVVVEEMFYKKEFNFNASNASAVKNSISDKRPFKNFEVQIIDGADGKCTAEFKVEPEHLNRGGFLHGGFTATVVDMVTTYALMSKPCNPGVSVDLHITYLKAAKEGDTIVVSANTIRAGKKLAFIECALMQKNDGAIVAKGSQTKFVECM